MAGTTTTIKSPSSYCPVCGALILPGRTRCISCNKVLSGDPTAGANRQAAARARSFRVDDDTEPSLIVRLRKPLIWSGIILVLCGGIYWAYSKATAHTNAAYKKFPHNRTKLVRDFFTYVSTDTNSEFRKAYDLISLTRRRPHKSNRQGHFWQRFHVLDQYLASQFGPQWVQRLRIVKKHVAGAKGSPTRYVVHVDTEVFHMRIAAQVPRGAKTPPTTGRRYGIIGMREFALSGGAKSQTLGLVNAYVGGFYGATGSAAQINGLHAAFGGSDANETPWQIKHRLLPIVVDPRATALQQCIYQLWPVRNDPTVRRALLKIMHDRRYSTHIRHVATAVYTGRAHEADLVGNGVPKVH